MLKWKNQAAATLASGILAGDTSIPLSAGHGARFPATSAENWFIATLRDSSNNLEVIHVLSRTVDTLDVVVRGQDGTTAIACSALDAIELRWANEDALGMQDDAVTGPTLSGTNTYTANLRVAPKAYNTGQLYPVVFANANTIQNPTVNLSSLGAKTIKRKGGIVVAIGDCSGFGMLHYDGTDMILLNPATGDDFPGSVKMSGNATADTGWLIADGSAVSRATYAALFTKYGTTYGVGDGVTTFNLPNFNGRSPVGVGQGNTAQGGGLGTARTLGGTGGAETHALTTAETAVHSHGVTDPGHTHGITDPTHAHNVPIHNAATGAGGVSIQGSAGAANVTLAPGTSAAATGISTASAVTGASTNNAGSGNAHNNMGPFLGINFMVKQ